jgi:hypothetical protein
MGEPVRPRRKLTLREAWTLCAQWDRDYEAAVRRSTQSDEGDDRG